MDDARGGLHELKPRNWNYLTVAPWARYYKGSLNSAWISRPAGLFTHLGRLKENGLHER